MHSSPSSREPTASGGFLLQEATSSPLQPPLDLQLRFSCPHPSDCLYDIKFRRIGCVTCCVMQVSVRQVRVVSSCLVITSLVKPGGFAMVLCRMLMVPRCFGVVFRCLF